MYTLTKKFISEAKHNGIKHALYRAKKYIIKKEPKASSMIFNSVSFGGIDYNPLVSLIAVNFNGEKDLPNFLDSIKKQSYKNFELIIVDNNSSDDSEKIIKTYQENSSKIFYLNSGSNLGFAEGNNYAIPYCKGEFFCLINIDTKVSEDWLKEMVDAISQDGDCAAVCSKTLFYERFQDIEIKFEKEFTIDIKDTINSLKYKKYFIRTGYQKEDTIYSKDKKIVLSLPLQEESINIKLLNLEVNQLLSYKIGKNKTIYQRINSNEISFYLDYNEENIINSSYIINNAGSISVAGMPGDRGIGEYDIGQYDTKCYVDFFCGVSVLLRRSLIIDRTIFIPEFFAYYEDSELSRYIREKGYKILYAPRSVVYHKHSATSSEGSALWQLLVGRSQKIYNYKNNPEKLYSEINHLEEYYKNSVNENVYNMLKKFSLSLKNRLETSNSIVKKLKPIGIYNSYWNTKGGGESHALSFATILQKYETVYLISEENFDIQELSSYYDIDLSNCRKIVQRNITAEFTKQFDIFINSTFQSNLESKANKSYYIVSFPHKNINKEVLNSYKFLYNSDYTKKWSETYWEKHDGDIIYPLGSINVVNKLEKTEKEKIILSIGRFFKYGHSKNQHVIAKAFKEMINFYPELKDWELVLIGSLNKNSKDDVEYLKSIENILQDTKYKIVIDAKRELLDEYCQKSMIYVHATGVGIDEKKFPERLEHFGITPVEAMAYGCFPIVYRHGGPAELISKLNFGEKFIDSNELMNCMIKTINSFNGISNIGECIAEFINSHHFPNRVENLYKGEHKDD